MSFHRSLSDSSINGTWNNLLLRMSPHPKIVQPAPPAPTPPMWRDAMASDNSFSSRGHRGRIDNDIHHQMFSSSTSSRISSIRDEYHVQSHLFRYHDDYLLTFSIITNLFCKFTETWRQTLDTK